MRRRLMILAMVLIGCLAAVISWQRAYDQGVAAAQAEGEAELQLYTEMTRGRLNQFRGVAAIYARDTLVKQALDMPTDAGLVDQLNRRLEYWNALSGAADTYVLNAQGLTMAASNWATTSSFIGENFAFRPYFQAAMRGQLGRYFALGTNTGVRGYYFAFPIRQPGAIVGAVVVKVSVERLEREIAPSGRVVFITDTSGVIIVSSQPGLHMQSLAPLSQQDIDAITRDRQFDLRKIHPIAPDAFAGALHLGLDMVPESWVLHIIKPLDAARRQAFVAAVLALVVWLAVSLIIALIAQRRRQLLERLAARSVVAQELEAQVAARTADLTNANENLRRAQAELVQAGKLAALGQMSAALSHEFNQPLTAIRTYTDNAIAFLGLGKQEQAKENMRRVMRLTERMAELSRSLIGFARKPRDTAQPTRLQDIIDETMALMRGRLERAGAIVTINVVQDLWVMGGQVRLQHVMMNLIGNALDATLGVGRVPDIAITAHIDGAMVNISVCDNGPGIAPEILDKVFDPFFSTKDVGQGLGLGLSISFNIMRDFGGSLHAANQPVGACFTVILPAAKAQGRKVSK